MSDDDDNVTVYENPESFNYLNYVMSVENSNNYSCIDEVINYDLYYTRKEQEQIGCLKCIVYTIITIIVIYTVIFVYEIIKNNE